MLEGTVLASAATVATGAVGAAAQVTASVPATKWIGSMVTSVVPSLVASMLPASATTTTPVTSVSLMLPAWFEVTAIFAGALAGGAMGVSLGFDVVGVLTLALVNGLGGGIIRDVLLQNYGIFALESPRALIGALAGGMLVVFFFTATKRLRPVLLVIDTASLALFCLVGSDKALVAGLTIGPAILLGTITAVGGGMMRDVLCDRTPAVLQKGSLYGTAALVGASAFVLMASWLHIAKGWALVVAAGLVVVMRMGSIWFGWESPEPIDLTDSVARVPARTVRAGRRLLGGGSHRRPPTDNE